MDFIELLKKTESKDSPVKELEKFVDKNLQEYIAHTKTLIT